MGPGWGWGMGSVSQQLAVQAPHPGEVPALGWAEGHGRHRVRWGAAHTQGCRGLCSNPSLGPGGCVDLEARGSGPPEPRFTHVQQE